MEDLTPVKGPSSPLEGRSAKVIAVILIAILVALIKPWGTESPAPISRASAPPVASAPVAIATSPTSFDPLANYDHEIFGVYEPEPRWELWPAGYLVSFGYAIRIESTPSGAPGVAPGASASASASPAASGMPEPGASGHASAVPSATPSPVGSPVPAPSGGPDGDGPVWPATIRITHGNDLGMIGVNTPLGYRVTGIGVTRTSNGQDEPMPVITPASDWPSHFTIVALADESRSRALDRWPPGTYRLDLAFEPGGIARTIEVEIEPSANDLPQPTARPDPS